MPRFVENRMILGEGPYGYIVVVLDHEDDSYLTVEIRHDSLIGAIAFLGELTEGEVIAAMRIA